MTIRSDALAKIHLGILRVTRISTPLAAHKRRIQNGRKYTEVRKEGNQARGNRFKSIPVALWSHAASPTTSSRGALQYLT